MMEIPVTISLFIIGISFKKSMVFLAFLSKAWMPMEAKSPPMVAITVAHKETRSESRIGV